MKDSFLLRGEWERHMELLTMEQRGELLTAIFAYQNRGEQPQGEPIVNLAFSFMRPFFDECAARYEEKVRANQENGKKGGRPKNPKNPVGFSETQPNPTKPVSDTVTDTVSDSVPPEGGDKARARRFTPPTLAEVASYVAERHSPVDAQEFIDFYAAKGWMVGKTPMKDWKAACRNAEKWDRWEKKSRTAGIRPGKQPSPETDERAKAGMERLRRLMAREEEKVT